MRRSRARGWYCGRRTRARVWRRPCVVETLRGHVPYPRWGKVDLTGRPMMCRTCRSRCARGSDVRVRKRAGSEPPEGRALRRRRRSEAADAAHGGEAAVRGQAAR